MPRTARALIALVLVAVGCGDPPLCQRDVFVAIQTSQIVRDSDAVAPGVQADVRVRTSLPEGERVTLEVLDGGGRIASTVQAAVDRDGDAVFAAVTVPTPRTTLRASAASICGEGEDEVAIEVLAGAGCELVMLPAPETNPYYEPLRVLSTLGDPDPTTAGYQTTIVVQSRSDWTVDLFEASALGELQIGMQRTDAAGNARFPFTPPDGRVTFRATCRGADVTLASAATTVVVDTAPPGCAFTNPAPGSSITPAYDQNGDLSDGVQLTLAAAISGADVAGEPTAITITPPGGPPAAVTSTLIDAAGTSTAPVVLAPGATPATYELALVAHDHAGNLCSATQTYDVVYDGCDIAIVSPGGPVTADANANPGDGSQVDVAVQVGEACVGRTVESTCGASSPSAVVPPGGLVVLRADACSTSPCETLLPCTVRVSTAAGVMTSASATIQFDDQGPPVSLDLVAPALACGASITPASDANPALDGVQVVARVTSAGAGSAQRSLELTNGAGGSSLDAAGDVSVTLEPGVNQLVGVALDALSNRSQTAPCAITLADLSVSFSPPAADGLVSRADGTPSGPPGGALTLPLCGTVNRTGAAVQLAIDGAAPVAATVSGTSWCRTVTLAESPPSHTIVAIATAGPSFGSGALVLRVDLTPPPAVGSASASAVNRQRVRLSWIAPSDGGVRAAGYLVKFATSALTDASFDTAGTVIATDVPALPGTPESIDLFPARTGTAYWIGIAAVDAAGNRSPAQVFGPITPGFRRTGAITAPDPSQGALGLGTAIAHGRFNDDAFEDLAVSAATQSAGTAARAGAVYVYFGGPSGISASPGLVVTSPTANGKLGAGLAAVRWSSAAHDDLVIGAPGIGVHGHLFVFEGGAGFPTGTRAASTADLHVAVQPAAPGWFSAGGLGSSLATADVDGDGIDDLVAAAPTGGGGSGGVAILYGGTVTLDVLLSDLDASGAAGAVVELFRDPGSAPNRQLGFYVHAVGPTLGPTDSTDDLVVAYRDDYATAGDSLFVLRGDGTRPAAPGVTVRPFAPGRDVRLDFATTIYKATEWGSQATSIADQNGDGARDLVISAFSMFNGGGQVLVVSGAVTGTGGVASTAAPGVAIATITGAPNSRFGAAVLGADDRSFPDLDGDGREDLVIGGVTGGVARAFVWFGGAIPAGAASVLSAALAIDAPPTFSFTRQAPQGPAGRARWVGDLDGDGLDDLCWASPFDNAGDGSFEVLSD